MEQFFCRGSYRFEYIVVMDILDASNSGAYLCGCVPEGFLDRVRAGISRVIEVSSLWDIKGSDYHAEGCMFRYDALNCLGYWEAVPEGYRVYVSYAVEGYGILFDMQYDDEDSLQRSISLDLWCSLSSVRDYSAFGSVGSQLLNPIPSYLLLRHVDRSYVTAFDSWGYALGQWLGCEMLVGSMYDGAEQSVVCSYTPAEVEVIRRLLICFRGVVLRCVGDGIYVWTAQWQAGVIMSRFLEHLGYFMSAAYSFLSRYFGSQYVGDRSADDVTGVSLQSILLQQVCFGLHTSARVNGLLARHLTYAGIRECAYSDLRVPGVFAEAPKWLSYTVDDLFKGVGRGDVLTYLGLSHFGGVRFNRAV